MNTVISGKNRTIRTRLMALSLLFMLFSCKTLNKSAKHELCFVDEKNFTIVGNDNEAPSISSGFREDDIFSVLNTLQKRPIKFLYLDKHVHEIPHIKYEISSCRDVVWAKNKLIDILNDTYEYTELDTVLIKRHYLINVLDSTKIKPCIEGVPWEMMSPKVMIEDQWLRKFQVRCYDWSIVKSLVSGEFSPRIHKYSIDSLQMSPISFKMITGYAETFGYDHFKKYLNDSLGLDLVVLEEDSIIMKAYKYLGLKEEENE